jgi:hypothetical protein
VLASEGVGDHDVLLAAHLVRDQSDALEASVASITIRLPVSSDVK